MPDCHHLETCVFFNDKMSDMPSTSTVFKMMYCTDNFTACARFMVRHQAAVEVPADLFPNQIDRARSLIGTR